MHNYNRVPCTKSLVAQKIANHSSGNFDIFNILFNILIYVMYKTHNWNRVSRIKSPVAWRIANHSFGDFEL